MKWNENDTKYIFKRLLIYLIITGIIFFTGTRCAKATVLSAQISTDSTYISVGQNTNNIDIYNGSAFTSAGEGELIGSFMFYTFNSGAPFLSGVRASTEQSIYQCDIGNQMYYNDNNKQYILITYRCPMNIQNNNHLKKITLQGGFAINDYIRTSSYLTYVAKGDNGSQAIIDANQNAMNNVIANIASGNATAHQDAQNIMNAVNNSTQQEVNAINSNTQAVNDLNDNIMQDYDVPDDIESDFEFSNWFSQEDSDFIRGILLFPLRIFYLISGALDSNSCIEYSFGRLYGYELKLPCINYKQYVGNAIYLIIDTVFALVIVFGLIRYMISVYDFVFSIGLKGASVVAAVEVFK